MWESLFGSAMAPAMTELGTQGIGEAMVPTITDQLANEGINQAMTGGLTNVGTTALGQVAPAVAPVGQGIFSSLGNFGNALGSDQFKNFASVGLGGYNAYNQGKAIDHAKNIQNQQLAMSQDAYNRDKTADSRRQQLVF